MSIVSLVWLQVWSHLYGVWTTVIYCQLGLCGKIPGKPVGLAGEFPGKILGESLLELELWKLLVGNQFQVTD